MNLIDDMDEVRYYQFTSGEVVKMEIELDDVVRVNDLTNAIEIGSFGFSNNDTFIYLTYMHLDHSGGKYLRKGIGRTILEFLKSYYQLPIVAAENDGRTRDDGSHLTGDAPNFVYKMREVGIIEPSANELEEDL